MKGEKLLSRIKKIDYSKKLNPIYIESIEANQIYINKIAEKTRKPVTWKVGKDNWVEFKKISTRKAVLNDSLFLRFMKRSIVRDSGDSCRDFIVVKFNYNAEYRTDDVEEKVDYHDLRTKFYKDGVTYIFEKRNKFGEVVEKKPIHYKMLMRSTGKAKDGECVFIRDDLHHKAINFLTMGLYDLMDEQSKNDPEKVFKLVEMSAYQTLTTATAIGYIQIPLENILIIKDVDVYTDPMHANIVKDVERTYTKDNVGSYYAGVPGGVVIDSYSNKKYGGTISNTGSYDVHIKSADGKYGDLGWVRLDQLEGYKSGTDYVDKDKLALVGEGGKSEMILHPDGSVTLSDGTVLTPLRQGTKVLNNAQTTNMFEWSQYSPSDMMSKSLEPKLPDITPAANNTTIQNENHLEIQIEKVLDYNDIIRKMQQDNRVIKFMQEVTIGQAMGHGKYRKNMISL